MKSVLLFLMLVLVFSSCQTSNSVVSKFGIQKRKYTKGWHTSKRKNFESLQAKKTTTPTDVTLSLKKSDVIEKVKLKNKKKSTQTTANLPAFTEQKQVGFTTKIEKRTENVKSSKTKKAKPLYLNKKPKSKKNLIKKQKKSKMDWDDLKEIGFVILELFIFFGIIALFLYLSTLSLALSIIFGVLIGIIVVYSVIVSYILLLFGGSFEAYSVILNSDIYGLLNLSALFLLLCILLLFALIIFAPYVLIIPQVLLTMLYIISIVLGIAFILITYFLLSW